MNKIINYIIPVITGILGFGLGYKYAMKNTKNALIDNEEKLQQLKKEINSIYESNSVNKNYVDTDIKSTKETVEVANDDSESDKEDNDQLPDLKKKLKPYDISEETYIESGHNYSTINLFYYLNGVLADHDDDVYDIKSTVGDLELPILFSKYDNSIIYIRDDYNEIDYRIYQCDKEFDNF